MYILFARRTHEHEGTFSALHIICSVAYSQDTCNSLLALTCLCIHMFLYSIFTWLHTWRGSLCMLHVFPKLYLLLFISLSKALMYVVINYQKWGDWKHKCSLGDLVINVNISLVEIILLSSVFQTSSTMAWKGQEDVEPLQDAKDTYWQKLKTLHFVLSDPRSHWVHRKANTIKRGWGVA